MVGSESGVQRGPSANGNSPGWCAYFGRRLVSWVRSLVCPNHAVWPRDGSAHHRLPSRPTRWQSKSGVAEGYIGPPSPWSVFCVWLIWQTKWTAETIPASTMNEPPAPTNSLFSKPASPIADKQCCQRTALVSGVCRHPPPTPGWLLQPCLSSSFKAYQLSFLGVRRRQRGWEAGPLCGVDQPRVVDPATLPPAPFHVSSQDEPRLMSVGLLGVWRFIRCSSVLCERVAGFATETIRCRMQPRRAQLRWLARLGLQSSCPAIARSSSDGCHLIGTLEWLLYQ